MVGMIILIIIGLLIILTWVLFPAEVYLQSWIDDLITDQAAKKKRKIVEEEEKRREELQRKKEEHHAHKIILPLLEQNVQQSAESLSDKRTSPSKTPDTNDGESLDHDRT